MNSVNVITTAQNAVIRMHKSYGETFQLLKYVPSATGGIYRQRRKQYQDPIDLLGCVSREAFNEVRTPIGEGSERVAHVTIPVVFAQEALGKDVQIVDLITTSDLIVIDNRVWRIMQCLLTGRIGDTPLIFDIDLREKVGASEVAYHGD